MRTSKFLFTVLSSLFCIVAFAEKNDCRTIVERSNPHLTTIDTTSTLSVGNGRFCFTTDITGLQTFPHLYSNPLGTYSEWGVHKPSDNKDSASQVHPSLPRPMHLGNIGFARMSPENLTDISQELDLWNGKITSRFKYQGKSVKVETSCHSEKDMIIADIKSPTPLPLFISFAYPSSDGTSAIGDLNKDSLHKSTIIYADNRKALLRRDIGETIYHIFISFTDATLTHDGKNRFLITPRKSSLTINVLFSIPIIENKDTYTIDSNHWHNFWNNNPLIQKAAGADKKARAITREEIMSIYLEATGKHKEKNWR